MSAIYRQIISEDLLAGEQERPPEQLPPELLKDYKERVRVLVAQLFRETEGRPNDA